MILSCALLWQGTGKIFIANKTYCCLVCFDRISRKGEQMKIDRLIGILSILLQKEMIIAPELAEHFEVSRRTIGRDIEALCKAGIPDFCITTRMEALHTRFTGTITLSI